MIPIGPMPTAESTALATLNLRKAALKMLEDAQRDGDKRGIAAWEKELRHLKRVIADYGIERYADRT